MLQVEEVSGDPRVSRKWILGGEESEFELEPLDSAEGSAHGEEIGGDADLRGKGEEVVRVAQRRRQTGLIVSSADERRSLTSIPTSRRSFVAFGADDAGVGRGIKS